MTSRIRRRSPFPSCTDRRGGTVFMQAEARHERGAHMLVSLGAAPACAPEPNFKGAAQERPLQKSKQPRG